LEFSRLYPEGRLRFRGEDFRAAFGRGGIRAEKHEGDGATPAAVLPLRRVLYRADRVARPLATVPTEPLAATDGWCDDPTHPDYNRQIVLPHQARHEELWRRDAMYDLIGVLGWNDSPATPNRGSAIFLHVARLDWAPTEGCVALALTDLVRLLGAGCLGIDASTES
jgi:L,D-peptidoglycan transpeptidase YkuD (ErfK/YbiS/YcfS/YnhG family)